MSKTARELIEAEQRHLLRRKHVHITMPWDAYVRVRTTLFQCNLTVSECFEEFACLLADEHPLATKLVDRCYRNSLARKLAVIKSHDGLTNFDELDSNAIYGLIDGGKSDDDVDDM